MSSGTKSTSTIVVAQPTMTKTKTILIVGAVVVGGALATYVVIKLMEALQLKDTREEKKEGKKTRELTTEESFDPTHARNKPSKVTISQQTAEQLAETIYMANGHVKAKLSGGNILGSLGGYLIDDDEDAVLGAVRQAGTTYNLSKVADVMYKKHKVGLLDFMTGFLEESYLSKVYDIVDNYKS
jgi:hypothetical protein